MPKRIMDKPTPKIFRLFLDHDSALVLRTDAAGLNLSISLFLSRLEGLAHACWVGLILVAPVIGTGCNQPEASVDATDSGNPAIPAVSEDAIDHFAVATQAVARGQFDVASDSLKQCLLKNPNDAKSLELSADIAVHQGDAAAGAGLYESAIDQRGNDVSRELMDKWAKSLLRAGRPYDSIEALRLLSERFPTDSSSRYDVAGIAAAFGVPELAIPALRWLVMRGQSEAESLLLLADPPRVNPDIESCEKLLGIAGEDRRAEYGLARFDASKEAWDKVATRLQPIVEKFPEFAPAHALYGQALFELGEYEKLEAWQASTPASAVDSSLYWITLGRWEQYRGQHENAALAFWEAVRRDGVIYPEVLPRLLVSVTQLNRTKDAEALAESIVRQTALRDALMRHLERSSESQTACMQVAEALVGLGRIWEAEGWARVAVSLPNEKLPDLRDRYLAIRNRLHETTPWQLPEASVATLVDLSDLARSNVGVAMNAAPSHATEIGQITFVDEALERGWDHTSIPATASGLYTIEETPGGGIAVIDFDCDGWPDLAAATLDGQPLKDNSSPNRLSRNLQGRFVDVSRSAGYHDVGYGHGIAVGDYNDDGFPDLFDANIGRNRLFRNNGDGTFTDVSDAVGLGGALWTTSATLVDLDGDEILDLFEVHYCAGEEPYERECRTKFGIGTCSPMIFDAEPDRVWQGQRDGTFKEVTSSWMIQNSPGRGLGLVAGELDAQPGMDVLVSNDMTVNHLWSSQSMDRGYQLVDHGVTRGLGTSGKSHSQASMGIAAGDADGDGDIDFLMTHFSNDYNTYYEQVAPGFWSDRSYPCGFAESSMKLLGFGTQWVDFDNAGGLELIITNGHVDRLESGDVAFHMPPQLYARRAKGRWEELDPKSLGPYFEKEHLGRALARFDVNRDGRCDVAISHLGAPGALLVNQTADAGKAIVLELRATSSPREAIGAKVLADLGSRTFYAQLTAGDGYMASNERRIHIGCGNTETIRGLTVAWPTGKVESFGPLEAGTEYLIVEGSGETHEVWRHQ